MNFTKAMQELRKGCKVRRRGWRTDLHIVVAYKPDGSMEVLRIEGLSVQKAVLKSLDMVKDDWQYYDGCSCPACVND